MAKQLAIKIKFQSTGQEQVINNISELEGAIDQLSKELKTLDFGSDEFKRTSKELQGLRSVLKDVDKETEGLDVEQRLSAFGGALDTISGSFLIAASAARTFGASVESVEQIQRIELQAMEAVNIALGIRQISEGLVQASLLKRIVTEKIANLQTKIAAGLQLAYTAAVGTSTGALKLFRLALIGTGIGAVIVLIGELIANWDNLTKAIFGTTKQVSQFTKIQAEARKNTALQVKQLDFYAGVVLDVNKSENERAVALRELNSLGVISEDINLDNAKSLELLANRIKLVRDNILLKAQAEAAAQLLTEALKEQIDLQTSSIDENVGFWDRLGSAVSRVYMGLDYQATLAEKAEKNRNESLSASQQRINDLQNIYIGFQQQLLKNEADLNQERENSTNTINDRTKAQEEENERIRQAAERTKQYTDSVRQLTDSIKSLNTQAEASAVILDKTQEIIDQQKELLDARRSFFVDETEQLIKDFNNLIGRSLIPQDVQKATKDQFFEIFQQYRDIQRQLREDQPVEIEFTTDLGEKGLTTFNIIKDEITGLVKFYESSTEIFDEFGNVTNSSAKSFDNIAQFNREVLNSLLSQVDAEKLKAEVGEDVFQSLIDITNANAIINEQLEDYNISLLQSEKILQDTLGRQIDEQKLREEISKIRKDGRLNNELDFITQEKVNKLLSKQLFNQEDLNKLNEQQLATLELANEVLSNNQLNMVDFNKLTEDAIKLQEFGVEKNLSTLEIEELRLNLLSRTLFNISDVNDLTEEQRKILDTVNNELTKQITYYEDILSVNEQFEKLTKQILDNLTEQGKQITDTEFEKLVTFIEQSAEGFESLSELEPLEKLIDELKTLELLRPAFEETMKQFNSFESPDELVNFINDLSTSSNMMLGLTTQQLDIIKNLAKTNVDELQNYLKTISFDFTNLTTAQIEELQRKINQLKFDVAIESIQEFMDKYVQHINNLTSQIQEILSMKLSLQLDQLSRYEESVLNEIGDQTERQKQIQEEFRQEIAEQRFELEKKARIQELRFQVASAISSGAQAVIQALALPAPPPIPQILAGTYATLSAIQIGVIQDQLNFVQSSQFVARRGGLVMGKSHEEGGVIMNNGQYVLEGGEAIINRNGGRTLDVDDSAIVQEIRKQNTRPIKTYVLYEDIKNTNKINSRLEQLSRL